MRRLLLITLLAGCVSPGRQSATSPAITAARFPASSDQSAWARFARETPPLPVWARTLVDSLPRTTALQLDLDALHRTRNPLGQVLAGRIRWAAADENRCAYAKQFVEADLARAGLAAEQLRQLAITELLPEAERAAIAFARKLTSAGHAISDEEVAELIRLLGEDDVVAVVHTVAHANFQDRIFLALGLESEPGGPCPPREVRLPADAKLEVPARALPLDISAASRESDGATAWREMDAAQVRAQLENQRARAPRIARPDAARLARLPRPDRERVAGTVWGKVSMGYQPVLTTAWFQTMGSFDAEAQLEDVFENTVFWVVTRSNKCFY